MTAWLSVIGIGDDGLAGLSPAARTLVETAEIAGRRRAPSGDGAAGPRPSGSVAAARSPTRSPTIAARRGTRVAVLASGDPLWYGVGAVLARHFPRDEMTILPQPSAFSLAAARLGWPLAECDARSACTAGRSMPLRLHLAPSARLLILSEDGTTPRRGRRAARRAGLGAEPDDRVRASRRPGAKPSPQHRRRTGATARAPTSTRSRSNARPAPGTSALSRLAGLPDDAFEHDGQLTKREMRAATLARAGAVAGRDAVGYRRRLRLDRDRVAARRRARRRVAIERDPGRAAMIARNAAALGVPGLAHRRRRRAGRARGVCRRPTRSLSAAASPTRPAAGAVVGVAAGRPAGRQRRQQRRRAGAARLAGAARRRADRHAVSRAEPLGGHHAWRPLLPVTQLAATKPG